MPSGKKEGWSWHFEGHRLGDILKKGRAKDSIKGTSHVYQHFDDYEAGSSHPTESELDTNH